MAQVVQVTRPIIEAASVRDSRRCMIAEAIQIANPHYRQIMVDLQSIRWTNPRTGKRYMALTPEEASIALIKFDRGDTDIEPFHVTLRPIQVTKMRERVVKSDEQLRLEGHDPATAPRSVRIKETRRAGRAKVRPRSSHPKDTSVVIEGGNFKFPMGHLAGSASALRNAGRAEDLAAKDEERIQPGNNVRNSSTVHRRFGRRLLVQ